MNTTEEKKASGHGVEEKKEPEEELEPTTKMEDEEFVVSPAAEEPHVEEEPEKMEILGKAEEVVSSPPKSDKKKKKKPVTPVVEGPPLKTGIAERIDAAVKARKPLNRSADLVPLNNEYDVMKKNLRALIAAAKKYHAARVDTENSRMELVQSFNTMAKGSPLHHYVSDTPVGDNHDSLESVCQLVYVTAEDDAKNFRSDVIDYAVEWDRVVTAKTNASIQETMKLHETLNHYQNKVDSLRKKVSNLEDKRLRSVPARLTEKLERNKEKLDDAWHKHEKSATRLCNLLEEVATHGWKDLFPLLQKMMEWEMATAGTERDILSQLRSVQENLQKTFEEHDVPADFGPRAVHAAVEDSIIEESSVEEEGEQDVEPLQHPEDEAFVDEGIITDERMGGEQEEMVENIIDKVPSEGSAEEIFPDDKAALLDPPLSPTGVHEHH